MVCIVNITTSKFDDFRYCVQFSAIHTEIYFCFILRVLKGISEAMSYERGFYSVLFKSTVLFRVFIAIKDTTQILI